jgi:uncharacterized protein involved in exopolysaccharide biosynthesis
MINTSRDLQDGDLNLLTYVRVIGKRKWLLAAFCACWVIAALLISLLLPNYYEAETVILPIGSEPGGLGTALSSLPLAGTLAAASGFQSPADRVMVLLQSRTIAEEIIRKFDLLALFYESQWDAAKRMWKDPENHPVMQDAVRDLQRDVVDLRKSKEGAVTIVVEWKDPKLAADIANYYVSVLTGMMNEKAINTTIQTIDRAVPAERKSRPRIKMNMLLAGVAGLFSGIFLIFVLDYVQKVRSAVPSKNTSDSLS